MTDLADTHDPPQLMDLIVHLLVILFIVWCVSIVAKRETGKAEMIADDITLSYEEGLMSGPILVTLKPSISTPPAVQIDEAFPMTVKFEVADLRYPDHRDARNANVVGASADPAELVRRDILRRMKVSFSLARATVEPATAQRITRDLSAAWSVSIPSAGSHDGFLITEIDHQDEILHGLYQAVVERNTPVTVVVSEAELTYQSILAGIGLILGVLLSVSNLVAFGWRWHDRKQSQKGMNHKSRIIRP